MTPLAILLAVALCTLAGCADPPEITDETDQAILQAFLGKVESSAAYCTPERMARFASQPEDITWQASLYLKMPLVAYQLTEDTRYLDMFIERTDTLCDQLREGPDGFLGWYGIAYELFRHPDHPRRAVDVLITSFTVAGLMADFAQIVRGDEALAEAYAGAADRYLDLAETHLIKKWEARGCYRNLGPKGAVYLFHPDLKPTKALLTEPHNKHAKCIRSLLSLYRATGKDDYLVKAIRLGTRFKHCLTLVEDRYRWNYLDPAGAWDIHPEDPNRWKHWIGPEHTGGYYSLSLMQAVLLYECGLVFDRTDLDRFLKTQTTVCWNGDLEDPQWANVDGEPGETPAPYLCSWLAPFDERVYQLAFEGSAQQERFDRRDHPWQGGPVACGWLQLKYLICPGWRSGEPMETDWTEPFLAKQENAALVESLAFEVTQENSYQAPATPAEMAPTPAAE